VDGKVEESGRKWKKSGRKSGREVEEKLRSSVKAERRKK
jgi:hypothetical protein